VRSGWRNIGGKTGADDHVANSLSRNRLLQRGAYDKAVARADAPHRFEQRQPSAAHQLHHSGVMLFAQALDDVHGIRIFEGKIEKNDRRPSFIE
jgi:hypothetical protein